MAPSYGKIWEKTLTNPAKCGQGVGCYICIIGTHCRSSNIEWMSSPLSFFNFRFYFDLISNMFATNISIGPICQPLYRELGVSFVCSINIVACLFNLCNSVYCHQTKPPSSGMRGWFQEPGKYLAFPLLSTEHAEHQWHCLASPSSTPQHCHIINH